MTLDPEFDTPPILQAHARRRGATINLVDGQVLLVGMRDVDRAWTDESLRDVPDPRPAGLGWWRRPFRPKSLRIG